MTVQLSRKKAAENARIASPAFNFLGKTSATVGSSAQAVGDQVQAPSAAGLRNGWASATIGSSSSSSSRNII